MANASECMCDNPYDVGTDNYFCHKYMYCYQKHGLIMNPSQCQFDCTQVGFGPIVAPEIEVSPNLFVELV
jgi:hypothetical protein